MYASYIHVRFSCVILFVRLAYLATSFLMPTDLSQADSDPIAPAAPSRCVVSRGSGVVRAGPRQRCFCRLGPVPPGDSALSSKVGRLEVSFYKG